MVSTCLMYSQHCNLHFTSYLGYEHVCRLFCCRCAGFVLIEHQVREIGVATKIAWGVPNPCTSLPKKGYINQSLVVGRATFPVLLGGIQAVQFHCSQTAPPNIGSRQNGQNPPYLKAKAQVLLIFSDNSYIKSSILSRNAIVYRFIRVYREVPSPSER